MVAPLLVLVVQLRICFEALGVKIGLLGGYDELFGPPLKLKLNLMGNYVRFFHA